MSSRRSSGSTEMSFSTSTRFLTNSAKSKTNFSGDVGFFGHDSVGPPKYTVDFSQEIKSGVSVVIPREKYERIRRFVDIAKVRECLPNDLDNCHDKDRDLQLEIFKEKMSHRAQSCPPRHGRHRGRRFSQDEERRLSDADDEVNAKQLREKLEKFRQEQETEIRRLNEMITEAKCLAVRESQIVDKEHRTREAKLSELEIDKRLEEQQLDFDRRIEEFRSKRSTINQSYADMIRQQIDANEALRKNAERTMRSWEAALNERRMDSFRQDMAQQAVKKLEQQKKLKEGLEECIVERKKLAERRKSEEAVIRQKMEEYAAERAAWRTSIQEAEAKTIAYRERLQSSAALERDGKKEDEERTRAVKTHLDREELDRNWRMRELQLEIDRREARRKLTQDREEQIELKKLAAAEEAARQLEQHARLLDLDIKRMDEHRSAELRRKQKALEYGEYVRSQIKEKEAKTKLDKENHLLEGTLVKKSEDNRDNELLEIKAKKLQELKNDEKIPNRYIMEIARKSRVPWSLIQ